MTALTASRQSKIAGASCPALHALERHARTHARAHGGGQSSSGMGLYARVDAAAAASDRREAGERSGRTGTSLPIASHRHTPTAPSRAASVLRSLRLRSNPCVWSIESHVCGPRALPARSPVEAAAPSRPMTLRAQTVQAVTSLRAKLIKAHAWRIGSVPTQFSLSVASQPRLCRRLGSAIGVGPTVHDAASAPATVLPVAPLPSWRKLPRQRSETSTDTPTRGCSCGTLPRIVPTRWGVHSQSPAAQRVGPHSGVG